MKNVAGFSWIIAARVCAVCVPTAEDMFTVVFSTAEAKPLTNAFACDKDARDACFRFHITQSHHLHLIIYNFNLMKMKMELN